MKNKTIYILLFSLTLAFLLMPVIQQYTGFPKLKELAGVENEAKLPPFSFGDFKNYNYQHNFENHSNQHLGFREIFIPVYNQIMWSLYRKTPNKDIRISDDNWMYEKWYIDDYYGNRLINYYSSIDIAKSSIKNKIEKLKLINEKLIESNTKLIIAILPGKARTYPEHIPDSLKLDIKDAITDSKLYSEYLSQTNISYIDLAAWFEQLKPQSPYLLFPQTGTHWSTYGSIIAADSIFKFMEKTKGIDMPNIVINSINETTEFKDVDIDMESLMNIILPIKKAPIHYPNISIESHEGKTKPKMIAICDSFWWNIYNLNLNPIFSKQQYYYYYSTVYSPDKASTNVSELNIVEEVKNTDYVLLMASTAQLCNIGWGFIDEMYNKLVEQDDPSIKLAKIEAKKREILGNSEWLESIKNKALEKNITTDSMIQADAEWLVDMGL